MKLSLNAMIIAGALFKTIVFLYLADESCLASLRRRLPAMLSSLYPGYDPVNVPIAVIVGTIYSLLAGALAAFFRLPLQFLRGSHLTLSVAAAEASAEISDGDQAKVEFCEQRG